MKKNTALALLLLNLSSFSAFSAGNESDNIIIDNSAPNSNIDNLVPSPVQQRIINQTKIVFDQYLKKKNLPIENYSEIIDITNKICYKENWNFFEISNFIKIISELIFDLHIDILDLNLNMIDLKNIIELSFKLLKNTPSKAPNYEELIKIILKKGLLNNKDLLEFFKKILEDNNLDLKSGLTPFIEAICDTNDEGRANLLEWQKNIFTLLPCEHMNSNAFRKLFQHIVNNPSQKPSEHHALFLNLLAQKKLPRSTDETLVNVLIQSNGDSFKAAGTLLQIIFATHPSWTYNDCLIISRYILDRATSETFIERFEFGSNLTENSDWRVEDYIKYVDDLYLLSEQDFKNITPLKDCNLDLKRGLTPFIKAICDTNDEGRANLLDWQKNIFTLLPCEHINSNAFRKLFQYIVNNPSQKPSEHHALFLNLLGQKELTHSINEILVNILIFSNETSFKTAGTLLQIISATHPSWTYNDCLIISRYILDRAMSEEFIDRFDFASNLLENSNWRVENYIKYINDLYLLPEQDFNNITPLLDKIFTINPSWTYDNYQAIYDNIVKHHTKPDFIERFNYAHSILDGNDNINLTDFKNYI
ncbi:MAG: hypothetical protein Q8K37_07355, partial [Alphaproteobacteria bacterium]|nr:hypothetical protein [Alphaproteobacteria bacterium]